MIENANYSKEQQAWISLVIKFLSHKKQNILIWNIGSALELLTTIEESETLSHITHIAIESYTVYSCCTDISFAF